MQTQIVFATELASFAVVMVFAGRALDKFGPQRLALTGGLVMGLGYFLAGVLGGTNFWVVVIGHRPDWRRRPSASAMWCRSRSACAGSPTRRA